jgi:lysophospholipase L1-like esterase
VFSRRHALRRVLPRLIFAIELFVVALIARQWAYVTTYRLYLAHEVGRASQTTVTQRFELENGRVVPRLVTRQAERLAFSNPVDVTATMRTELQPKRPVRYSIAWRTGTRRQILADGVAVGRVPVTQGVPAGPGVLELETDGPATWNDPRLVRGMHIRRHVIALALLIVASYVTRKRTPDAERQAIRLAWFKAAALATTVGVSVLACEVALRALGDHAPSGVLALRHDLGENTPDERWEDSPRYGRRLRAAVDTENAWKYGDIVRMGFVPAAVGPGVWRRYRFSTDAEGFRNRAVREHVDIAALGDSFTDAMTVPFDASWPARLEQRLGIAVQNYGTAGFGPQQELLVLRDYVVRHRPSRVVLAYFAGNDLFDAERFDRFEQLHGHDDAPTLGWPIKDIYSRADTWRVTSALAATAGWLAGRQEPFVVNASEVGPRERAVHVESPFDRGLFSLHVGGKLLQWAFMPPYLNTLNFSEGELRQRSGWRLTRDAILAMHRTSHEVGAEFIVMFLPFKSQVYWPLLERHFSPRDLRQALSFYLDDNGRPNDIGAMSRNRLAQNAMMRDLCESAGIPFLDTTPALQRRVELGDNVYFADDSHLNELGQYLVAETLAAFLHGR